MDCGRVEEIGKMNETHSNTEIFTTIAGMTITIFGLLAIFLSYVLKLNPSLTSYGLVAVVVGLAGVLYSKRVK